MPQENKDLVEKCRALLGQLWSEIEDLASQGMLVDVVGDLALRGAIQRSIVSDTLTYRYVLPTQVLAKLADASLDCHCLQVAAGKRGAFDARSLCHKVVVPFDRQNHSVLGGSPEPYVNNPLRVPEVTLSNAGPQKNKAGWADLCMVLDAVEASRNQQDIAQVFRQVLIEIHRRLATVHVTYPTPIRISLERTIALLERFLSDQSGGDRAQAVASALFRAMGATFGLYSQVRRAHTNAPDASSGQVADLECLSHDGRIVWAIEVKDKPLTAIQVQDKLPRLRELNVQEVFFLAFQGMRLSDRATIAEVVAQEYGSGQNIYIIVAMDEFLRTVSALLGETGRRQFLEMVGEELDTYRSDIRHRRAWADLLSQT